METEQVLRVLDLRQAVVKAIAQVIMLQDSKMFRVDRVFVERGFPVEAAEVVSGLEIGSMPQAYLDGQEVFSQKKGKFVVVQ